MKTFILAKVFACSVNDEPKDLAKGITHILVLETTKKVGAVEVPDFVKAKSITKIEPSNDPQFLEVEIFNIPPESGKGKVQSYYRILRKADLTAVAVGGKK